jgi:hypothetical protein
MSHAQSFSPLNKDHVYIIISTHYFICMPEPVNNLLLEASRKVNIFLFKNKVNLKTYVILTIN